MWKRRKEMESESVNRQNEYIFFIIYVFSSHLAQSIIDQDLHYNFFSFGFSCLKKNISWNGKSERMDRDRAREECGKLRSFCFFGSFTSKHAHIHSIIIISLTSFPSSMSRLFSPLDDSVGPVLSVTSLSFTILFPIISFLQLLKSLTVLDISVVCTFSYIYIMCLPLEY